MAGRVEDKVAIVTGAASGIGRGCAELLAREGARVVLTDVNEEQGREAAKAIGGDAVFAKDADGVVRDVHESRDVQDRTGTEAIAKDASKQPIEGHRRGERRAIAECVDRQQDASEPLGNDGFEWLEHGIRTGPSMTLRSQVSIFDEASAHAPDETTTG